MQGKFENIIESYLQNNIGIVEHFLPISVLLALKNQILALQHDNMLMDAKIGNAKNLILNKTIRKDKICWLANDTLNSSEKYFLHEIELFIAYLNKTCFTNINHSEFHYAYYDKGSFYKKHFDQFSNQTSRAYSVILYLNEHWIEADGGQLCIHHSDKLELINPTWGKLVFFKSNALEHEVLLSNAPRMSITGWLRIDG